MPNSPKPHLPFDEGQDLLASQFTSVVRRDFTSELHLPGPEPIEEYMRSMISIQDQPDLRAVAAAVASRFPASRTPFRVRTHAGCLVCT